jgi:hypothetical protein
MHTHNTTSDALSPKANGRKEAARQNVNDKSDCKTSIGDPDVYGGKWPTLLRVEKLALEPFEVFLVSHALFNIQDSCIPDLEAGGRDKRIDEKYHCHIGACVSGASFQVYTATLEARH